MSGGIHKFPEVGPEDYEVCTMIVCTFSSAQPCMLTVIYSTLISFNVYMLFRMMKRTSKSCSRWYGSSNVRCLMTGSTQGPLPASKLVFYNLWNMLWDRTVCLPGRFPSLHSAGSMMFALGERCTTSY